MSADHIFNRLQFDEETHTYTLDGRTLRSVSSVVDGFKKPFDAPAKAAEMEARGDGNAADLLSQWEATRAAAADKGTALHAYIHAWATGQKPQPLHTNEGLQFNLFAR